MDLLLLYYRKQLREFIKPLEADKYLRIITIHNELNTTKQNRFKVTADYLGHTLNFVRSVVNSGGKPWESNKRIKMKKTIQIPARITADQFGLSQKEFDKYVRGQELEIHSETKDYVYVLVDNCPHGISKEDLLPDEDYIIEKQKAYIEYLGRKKEEIEGLNKAA